LLTPPRYTHRPESSPDVNLKGTAVPAGPSFSRRLDTFVKRHHPEMRRLHIHSPKLVSAWASSEVHLNLNRAMHVRSSRGY
jgi:hypothetical protein